MVSLLDDTGGRWGCQCWRPLRRGPP